MTASTCPVLTRSPSFTHRRGNAARYLGYDVHILSSADGGGIGFLKLDRPGRNHHNGQCLSHFLFFPFLFAGCQRSSQNCCCRDTGNPCSSIFHLFLLFFHSLHACLSRLGIIASALDEDYKTPFLFFGCKSSTFSVNCQIPRCFYAIHYTHPNCRNGHSFADAIPPAWYSCSSVSRWFGHCYPPFQRHG